MNSKTLANSNPHLRSNEAAARRVRSVASSTAIETRKGIKAVEDSITHLRAQKQRAKLA